MACLSFKKFKTAALSCEHFGHFSRIHEHQFLVKDTMNMKNNGKFGKGNNKWFCDKAALLKF